MKKSAKALSRTSAERLLLGMTERGQQDAIRNGQLATKLNAHSAHELVAADLVARHADGRFAIIATGWAFLRRSGLARAGAGIDPYLGQHLALAQRELDTPNGKSRINVDEAESPLAWLSRRKGKDGRPLIESDQFHAGERLRAEFTRAQLMPRTTSNWNAAIANGAYSGDGGADHITDVIVAARQRVRRALSDIGPEFAGLLLDVCCFLKGLEDVERERGWPPRSAKVVLQLGLDRLARHYGLASEARGRTCAPIRTWLVSGSSFAVDGD